MPILSNKDTKLLLQRGISVQAGEITFKPVGIGWLLNYLHSEDILGSTLTLSLLKEVANFQPNQEPQRSLLIKAFKVPSHSRSYFLLVVYLEGSPPRAFHALPPRIEVSKCFGLPSMEHGAFKVKNDQIVRIEFSDADIEKLNNEELVKVDY